MKRSLARKDERVITIRATSRKGKDGIPMVTAIISLQKLGFPGLESNTCALIGSGFPVRERYICATEMMLRAPPFETLWRRILADAGRD